MCRTRSQGTCAGVAATAESSWPCCGPERLRDPATDCQGERSGEVSGHTNGESIPRIGARDRVTGAQKYTADLPFPGALHVKLVHLDAARLAIRKIRRDAAAQVPGFLGIVTAEDLPEPIPRFGPAVADRPLLADGETRFSGEPVAAVAAETLDAARRAAA